MDRENAPNTKEILTLNIGNECYGIDILSVKEIKTFSAVRALTDVPDFMLGVMNLRGDIIPVVDLRIKLGTAQVSYDEFTVMVMIQADNRITGIVVDEVCDVIKLDMSDVQPPPELICGIDKINVKGLIAVENQTIILVDMQELVLHESMGLIDRG